MSRRRSISPIGVDFGPRWIRAVQLSRRRGGWRLHAAAAIPRASLPESADAAHADAEHSRLAGILERRGFDGNDIILAVPQDRLIWSIMELPPRASGAPIAELAKTELARTHKTDAASLQVALWEIPPAARTAEGVEYMVAACTHETAIALIDPFERAGLQVAALDVRSLALVRACAPRIRSAPSMDAILSLGWDQATLLVMIDGVISFKRGLEGVDGKTLVAGAAQRLGLQESVVADLMLPRILAADTGDAPARRGLEAEAASHCASHIAAIGEQLNISCSYVSRRYADRDLTSVLLTGEFAGLPGLPERISTDTITARPFLVPDAVDPAAATDPALLGAEMVAALGLAMHPERAAA